MLAGPLPAEQLVTTAPHPFWVVDAEAFVAAADLKLGDQFLLADGTTTTVIGLSIADAPAGTVTYNFEVADFHTYFVGEDGVWVHNAGSFNCERFFSHVDWMMKKDGSTKREAFEKILRLSDPDLHTPGSPGYETAKRLAGKYDPHLALAAREVMQDAYTRAIEGGVVDLSKVPTTKQLYESLGFEQNVIPGQPKVWANGRASASLLEIHHTASKKVARTLLERLGAPYNTFTDAQWADLLDEMPGFLINAKNLDPAAGPAHQILTTTINAIDLAPGRSVNAIFADMANAYQQWDQELGPKVWQVAMKWFETKSVTP